MPPTPNMRIEAFSCTSGNVVKAQIWPAVCVYVLAAIVKKRLAIKARLYEMLQILSLMLFEKSPLLQLFTGPTLQMPASDDSNQLDLFD